MSSARNRRNATGNRIGGEKNYVMGNEISRSEISKRFYMRQYGPTQLFCCTEYQKNLKLEKQGMTSNEIYDLVPQEDAVKEQYKLLPYPARKSDTRRLDFDDIQTITESATFSFTPDLTLESINSYLFQGRDAIK